MRKPAGAKSTAEKLELFEVEEIVKLPPNDTLESTLVHGA